MYKKDSRNNSHQTDKPSLAVFYEKAHKNIYDCTTYVHNNKYSIFHVFSDDLRELKVGEREYAYTIVKLLRDWLSEKNLKVVPINVFCGDWCLRRYLKIKNSETVTITNNDKEEELLHSELTIARYYISKNLESVLRFGDAVKDIEKLLSKRWLEMYRTKTFTNKFKYKALDIISEEFGFDCMKDYNDIIGKLRCRS
jgi:hypothetical protein